MASATSVVFDIVGRDRASETFDRIGRATADTTSKMERFHKVGAAAGKALAVGLAAAGYAAIAATKAAADDALAASKLAQQLRQSAGATDAQVASTEKWITAQGLALGVSDDELRPALAKLATATGSVSKAQKLASLAMDISTGSGKSLESVTGALAKAQSTGSVAALAKFGIATKDAAGNTKSLAQVTDELSGKYKGSAANAASTVAGQTKIATVQFGELQEQIGAKLLPVMLKLAQVGLQVVNWVSQNTTTVGVLVGSLGALLAITWGVSKAIEAWSAITKIASAVQIVWTNIQWAFNAAMAANPIGLVVIAIVALVAAFIIAYKHSETFRNIVNAAFSAIEKVVTSVVSTVVGFVKDHWGLLVSLIGGPIGIVVVQVIKHFDTIKSVIGAVASFVVDSAKKYAQFASAVIDKVGDVVEFFKKLPGKITGFLDGLPSDLATIGGQIIEGLKRGIEGAAHLVWDAVKAIVDKIPKKIRDIMGISSPSKVTTELGEFIGEGLAVGLEKTSGKVSDAAQKTIDRLKSKLSTLKDAFSSLKDSVAGAFSGNLFEATNASDFLANLTSTQGTLAQLRDAFKKLAGWGLKPEFLAQLFQSGNSGLILDLANNQSAAVSAGSAFGSITSLSNALGGQVAQDSFGADIASTQQQIKGKGKGGKDDDNKRVGDTYNITVNGSLDGDDTADKMVKAIKRIKRVRYGGQELGIA